MNLKETKSFLKENGILPKKSLGQNFLIHSAPAQKIVRAACEHPGPYVEIGPGLGALTRLFPSHLHSKMTLIEKDRKLALYWKNKGFSTLHEDALKTRYDGLPAPMVLTGNLPYQISGPLILKLSQNTKLFQVMIFMFQKEVAMRLQARPRTKPYGLLSVMAQTFWRIQRIGKAKTSDFYPPPKVEGHVLKFLPAEDVSLSAARFLRFLKILFQERRKKLSRKLSSAAPALIEELLISMGHSPMARPEELSTKDFLFLYKKLFSKAGL